MVVRIALHAEGNSFHHISRMISSGASSLSRERNWDEQVSKPGVAYCSGLWGLLHLHGDGCDGALRQNGPQVVIFVILGDVVYALDALKVLEPGGHVLTVERPDGALESLNEGDCRWRSLVVHVDASFSLVLGVNVPLLESVVHFAIVRQSFLRLNYRTGSVGPCEDCLGR